MSTSYQIGSSCVFFPYPSPSTVSFIPKPTVGSLPCLDKFSFCIPILYIQLLNVKHYSLLYISMCQIWAEHINTTSRAGRFLEKVFTPHSIICEVPDRHRLRGFLWIIQNFFGWVWSLILAGLQRFLTPKWVAKWLK